MIQATTIRRTGQHADIYINGDNGTSAEGGPLATPNEVAFFNGLNKIPAEEQLKLV